MWFNVEKKDTGFAGWVQLLRWELTVAQTDLIFVGFGGPLALGSLVTALTGVRHHAWLGTRKHADL